MDTEPISHLHALPFQELGRIADDVGKALLFWSLRPIIQSAEWLICDIF